MGLIAGEGDQTGAAGRRLRFDGIDNNRNGLVDEDSTQAVFGSQVGVGFADYVDNDGDGEPGSPVVTQAMIDAAAADRYGRWPVNPADNEPVWLIGIGVPFGAGDSPDLGKAFRDNIDNDGDAFSTSPPLDYLWEPGSPIVTQEMVTSASSDAPYFRFACLALTSFCTTSGRTTSARPTPTAWTTTTTGPTDEGIDENIDEMIDERRDDGIDNDGDWRAALDDVGLDGADQTRSTAARTTACPRPAPALNLPGEAEHRRHRHLGIRPDRDHQRPVQVQSGALSVPDHRRTAQTVRPAS